MNASTIIGILIGVILFAAGISIIGNSIADTTQYPRDSTSVTGLSVPYNISLDEGTDCVELLYVVNGSSGNLPASDYTDYCSAGKVEIKDNSTFGNTLTAYYNYDDGTTLTGTPATLIGLSILFVIIGFITLFLRNIGAR